MNLSRRTFLEGAVAAPAILGAQDKSGSKRPVIGSGEYTYEVFHDWGELPSRIKYGNTHGVCQDSPQGYMYIHHTVHKTSESPDSMVVFDERGKFVRSWGAEYRNGAHGLHIRREGSTEYLYLCDINRKMVVKTTLKGEPELALGYPEDAQPYKAKIPYIPTNLAVAPNGDIYVADGYGSSYVNRYNSEGHYLQTFGGLGSEAGDLNQPHGIWMDTRGDEPVLAVADRRNYRIQTFTLDGKHIAFIPGLRYPCHFHTRGQLMVVPELEARLSILDGKNAIVAHFGQGPDNFREVRLMDRNAFIPGQFVAPHSACFDHEGNIFVVEWVEIGRVTKLRKVA